VTGITGAALPVVDGIDLPVVTGVIGVASPVVTGEFWPVVTGVVGTGVDPEEAGQ